MNSPVVVRIYVSRDGVMKVEGEVSDAGERRNALALTEKLMPAIRRLDTEVRKAKKV
jgi:hypothetical protein